MHVKETVAITRHNRHDNEMIMHQIEKMKGIKM